MKRLFVALFVLAGALGSAAQAQAPTPGAPKIAISSLVGDALTVTVYRGATASNLSNASNVLKMPGPLLDIALLKAAQQAVGKAVPGAAVFPLKVAVAGSNVDPTMVVVDDKVVAGNVLVEALRQQGFTHLLTATKYRHNNVIRLAGGPLSTRGALEGMGFYVDPTLRVQETTSVERSEGIVAPYLYIQLRLVDLATMEVRTQSITANSAAAAAQNKEGTDAWGALTAEEKMQAAQSLIESNVAQAVPALFQPK